MHEKVESAKVVLCQAERKVSQARLRAKRQVGWSAGLIARAAGELAPPKIASRLPRRRFPPVTEKSLLSGEL